MNTWKKIDLCGAYRLALQKHADYLHASAHPVTYAEVAQFNTAPITGKVPGNFELDMVEAGLLPDPFYGENLLESEKMEDMHLFYARKFDYSTEEGTEPWLVFEGIDTVAEIYLNGKKTGSCDNMFIPQEFPAQSLLREGENELVVHIAPACIEARKNKISAGNTALKYNYEALRLRKAPHMFGWDIMPRIVSAGIFRPVRLEYRPAIRLNQAYLMTAGIDLDRKTAHLQLFYDFKTQDADLSRYEIEVTGRCGDSSFYASERPWFTAGKLDFTAENVRFWWPKGYGAPDLYQITVSIKKDGAVLDTIRHSSGIRTVHLEHTGLTDAFFNGKFHFEVNGRKIFILGTNFVPIDAFHSRDRQRLPAVMDLLDDSGCNAIRCWGGGVYEDDYLYTRCDELGILIWQDFMMACALHPTDEEFCRVIRHEAEAVVRRLRHHASIMLWSGDNECDQFTQYGAFPRDPNRNRITRQVLQDVIDAEDPTRPYLPSSPYVGPDAARLVDDTYLTERHLWGPRDYFKSEFYKGSLCNFASEIGYHGCPSRDSLEKFLPADKLWPWQNNDAWMIHAASPEKGTGGSYAYRIELMAKQIRELFGTLPDNLEDFILASQISQAEAFKFFIELFRTGKPNRTGIIWWNLIDGWPQFSDAVVDYYFNKKLAYYYIKQVQQPILLSVAEPKNWCCEVKLVNDTGARQDIFCRINDYMGHNRTVYEGIISIDGEVKTVTSLPYSQGEKKIYTLEWTCGDRSGKNHYLAGNPPFELAFYRDFLHRYYPNI